MEKLQSGSGMYCLERASQHLSHAVRVQRVRPHHTNPTASVSARSEHRLKRTSQFTESFTDQRYHFKDNSHVVDVNLPDVCPVYMLFVLSHFDRAIHTEHITVNLCRRG